MHTDNFDRRIPELLSGKNVFYRFFFDKDVLLRSENLPYTEEEGN